MRKNREIKLISIILILIILFPNFSIITYGAELKSNTKKEFSEEYKKYLNLSDEEKKKYEVIPDRYETDESNVKSQNILERINSVGASFEERFSLRDIIPENVLVEDQMGTGCCWTFASLHTLETHLGLKDYRNNVQARKIYDFSERHMAYGVTREFLNNQINIYGLNTKVSNGGRKEMASAYLVCGIGAVKEEDMPFENNENDIQLSEIQNKEVVSQLYDFRNFPYYFAPTGTEFENVKERLKQHIKNYGAVYASINIGGEYFNDDTNASFYNENYRNSGHAVAIIGWDDNYSRENFRADRRPNNNGAWIALNSWGSSFGYNGLYYISYEDKNVYCSNAGVEKATGYINYDNLYQYDEQGAQAPDDIRSEEVIYIGNVFDKKTNQYENLTQILFTTHADVKVSVYVNPNGASKNKEDLQLVKLKEGTSKTVTNGRHTLEFNNPIKLTSDKYVVVLKLERASGMDYIPLTLEIKDDYITQDYYYATVETNKCFFAKELSTNTQWTDLSKLNQLSGFEGIYAGDSSIKAYTKNSPTNNDIEKIEITEMPNNLTYIEGYNFDKTGMKVIAKYKDGCINEINNYTIENGNNLEVGQNSVLIKYNGVTTECSIIVKPKELVNIQVTKAPNKTQYIEGQNFDTAGMEVTAYYNNETSEKITNYEIINGNNLTKNQNTISISYGGKTITYSITVNAKELVSIQVVSLPNKTTYIEGEDFDRNGLRVYAIYNNDTSMEITDYTIVNGKNLKVGQNSIEINYNWKKTYISIVVNQKQLTSIEVTKEPDKSQYIEGQTFNALGMEVTAYYNNNTSEIISNYRIINGNDLTINQNTITISYGGKTTDYSIAVYPKEIVSLQVVNPPRKTIYLEGQNFDKDGLIIYAIYNNDTSIEITDYTIRNGENLKNGQISVEVNYNDKKVNVPIVVNQKQLVNIEVTKAPDKLEYIEGQNFDTTGMEVTAYYNNNTSEIIHNYEIKNGSNLAQNQNSILISYGVKTITYAITVNSKNVVSIQVINPANKTTYLEGENFNKEGLIIKATYNDGTSSEITNFTIKNGQNLKLGQSCIGICYKGLEINYPIVVNQKQLLSIEVTKEANKTEYIKGQNFDITGMEITAYYSNSEPEIILNYEIVNGNNLTNNQNTVTISYNGKTVNHNIIVYDKEVIELKITSPAKKTSYIEGENFDKDGLVVSAVYNDGTSMEITDYTIKNGENLELTQSSVEINYGDKKINVPMLVKEKILMNIEVTKAPNKTEYVEGQDFDDTGMEITAYYNNNKAVIIEDYTIRNGTNLTTSNNTIDIVYQNKTVNYQVKVINKDFSEIRIISNPNKTEYIEGQSFDKEGLKIVAIYNDNTSIEVEDYKIEDGTNLYKGQENVTISFGNKKVLCKIEVKEKELVSLELITKPSKTDYLEGEDFDAAGMVIQALYDNDSLETIKDYTIENGEKLKANQKNVTIKYKNKTINVSITVKKRSNIIYENVNLDGRVKHVTEYTFKENESANYALIDVELSIKDDNNSKYYYYLSTSPYEEEINDYSEIKEFKNTDTGIEFSINTKDIKNYSELISRDKLYLYIKQKNNVGTYLYNPIVMNTDVKYDRYEDDEKKTQDEEIILEEKKNDDNTTAKGSIPYTGMDTLRNVIIGLLAVYGITRFIRYKGLSIKMKLK